DLISSAGNWFRPTTSFSRYQAVLVSRAWQLRWPGAVLNLVTLPTSQQLPSALRINTCAISPSSDFANSTRKATTDARYVKAVTSAHVESNRLTESNPAVRKVMLVLTRSLKLNLTRRISLSLTPLMFVPVPDSRLTGRLEKSLFLTRRTSCTIRLPAGIPSISTRVRSTSFRRRAVKEH